MPWSGVNTSPQRTDMNYPKLACCNFIDDATRLRAFALDHGFDGVDWTFTNQNFPQNPAAETELIQAVQSLHPLEVRFHCAFAQTDLGDEDPGQAVAAFRTFQAVCRLVAKLRGQYVTIHIGLGRDSTFDLCWDRTMAKLRDLVQFSEKFYLRLCLENLAWGWTSRPELYEKLLRKSGAWATLDIGHAQVCPSVASQQFRVADFVRPQPERIRNAHVYHAENSNGHIPPQCLEDIRGRLNLLGSLPLCDWWVLELREETALHTTLAVIREHFAQLQQESARLRFEAATAPVSHP
jgi:sugar phosphate isomerase/epimerase